MSEPFIAQIMMFGGNFAPRGWALCYGQILSIAQNTALFSLLGTTYGGNGQTTFALPDLRGRVPVGTGQGPGLSTYQLGQMAGTETTTLLTTQMPAHAHTTPPMAVDAKATLQSPANGALLGRGSDGAPTPTSIPRIYVPSGTSGTAATLGTGSTNVAGGSQPFSTMQPYLAMNYIIALEGIYPSRN